MEKIIIKRKRRKNLFFIIVLLILFFTLYFIFEDFGIYIEKERSILVKEPFNITKEVSFEKEEKIPACENRTFRYSTNGGNVEPYGNSVRPNLILNNLEDRWGEYYVNFSFIDESKYPYDIYGGGNLIKNIEEGKISWEDGDFFSVTYKIMMPPKEGVLIDDLTQKKDKNKNYWAMAEIVEPWYEYCYDKIISYNLTENRTFIEYRQAEKKVRVKEYTKAFDILSIDSFGEWVIIVMMFFLIILLLGRIKERYKMRRIAEKGADEL